MPAHDEFDWCDRSRIAVHPVQAIAVYRSRDGIVLRQQKSPDGRADALVLIPEHSITNVINRLRVLQDDAAIDTSYEELPEAVIAIVD